MKTTYYKASQGLLILFALLICTTTQVHAQNLVPPTSPEMNFGPSGPNPTCFNIDDIVFPIAFGKADIYLSAVDRNVNWMAFHPVTGAFVIGGSITYQNCTDLNVGIRYNGVNPQLVVAYYSANAPKGHKVDVYNWNAGGGSVTMATGYPLSLSTLVAYTRISMDTHTETSGFSSFNAIVWEDPGTGINISSCVGAGAFIGGPIPGTVSFKRPDVAFSHVTAGSLNLHFVYHSGTGPSYTIRETFAPFSAMNVVSPAAAALQDVNSVSGILGLLSCSMDCPDHNAAPDIWTYAYSNNTASIFARISPTGSGGITKDVLATSSFVGLLTGMTVTSSEVRPRVSYNQSGASFHIAFFSNLVLGAVSNNYYSMQINSAGTTLISTNDYERVAAATAPGGAPRAIALSKQNSSNKYLYAVFSTSTGGSAGFVHKFHKWTNTTNFKTTGIENLAIANELLAGPNPFAETVSLYVPENLKNETMTASLTDMSGRLLLSYNGLAGEASIALEQASKNLAAGTYFLKTSIKSAEMNKNFKLQCTGTR